MSEIEDALEELKTAYRYDIKDVEHVEVEAESLDLVLVELERLTVMRAELERLTAINQDVTVRFHWLDGQMSEGPGRGAINAAVAKDAFARLGFAAGAMAALDYWEIVA
jgi:hypothetical protein